ncbi:unnamed protein product, partial [Symbiodinium sp. CCMP2592]
VTTDERAGPSWNNLFFSKSTSSWRSEGVSISRSWFNVSGRESELKHHVNWAVAGAGYESCCAAGGRSLKSQTRETRLSA